MHDIDRRSMLVVGVAASTLVFPAVATAQTYGPTEGKEVAPGVREVDLGERESVIPAYKKVRLRDIVIASGAKTQVMPMPNDMVCLQTEGELAVVQNEKQFTAKKGDVWTCAKGMTTEGTQNKGNTVAIMRVIDLMTA